MIEITTSSFSKIKKEALLLAPIPSYFDILQEKITNITKEESDIYNHRGLKDFEEEYLLSIYNSFNKRVKDIVDSRDKSVKVKIVPNFSLGQENKNEDIHKLINEYVYDYRISINTYIRKEYKDE